MVTHKVKYVCLNDRRAFFFAFLWLLGPFLIVDLDSVQAGQDKILISRFDIRQSATITIYNKMQLKFSTRTWCLHFNSTRTW